MDKVTRILRLYSQLAQGKKVNKVSFCMEVECSERTFDRDIEDIRLYLSEFFFNEELIYIKSENTYCFTNGQKQLLEPEEYLFLERVLLDTKLLKGEELKELLFRIASNTEKATQMSTHGKTQMKMYEPLLHNGISLKLFYDMIRVIEAQCIIQFVYPQGSDEKTKYDVIPCRIEYKDTSMKLIAMPVHHREKKMEFELHKIESFSIIRKSND